MKVVCSSRSETETSTTFLPNCCELMLSTKQYNALWGFSLFFSIHIPTVVLSSHSATFHLHYIPPEVCLPIKSFLETTMLVFVTV